MTVAHDGDHVAAVVAEVLDGPLPRHVSLVRHQREKDQNEDAQDCRHGDAREAAGGLLERQEGEDRHRSDNPRD